MAGRWEHPLMDRPQDIQQLGHKLRANRGTRAPDFEPRLQRSVTYLGLDLALERLGLVKGTGSCLGLGLGWGLQRDWGLDLHSAAPSQLQPLQQ